MEGVNETGARTDREVSFDEFYGDEVHNNNHLKVAIDSFGKSQIPFAVCVYLFVYVLVLSLFLHDFNFGV